VTLSILGVIWPVCKWTRLSAESFLKGVCKSAVQCKLLGKQEHGNPKIIHYNIKLDLTKEVMRIQSVLK
jgi:hypothetical protein